MPITPAMRAFFAKQKDKQLGIQSPLPKDVASKPYQVRMAKDPTGPAKENFMTANPTPKFMKVKGMFKGMK